MSIDEIKEENNEMLKRTWIEFAWYLWYSVFALRSSISTFGKPDISSSNSCSLNIEINRFGMMS